jgi:hypothetical protein
MVSLPNDLTPGTYQVSVEAFECSGPCDLDQPLGFRDSQGVERPAIRLPSVLTIGG